MVEPSDNLQAVFEKAIDTAKQLNHEYLTIEHLLFAMLCEDSFANAIQGYGSDPEYIKKNLEHYLKNKCDEIVSPTTVVKPKKTQTPSYMRPTSASASRSTLRRQTNK